MDDKQLIFVANSECMRIIPRNPRVAVLAGLAVEVRKRLLSNRKRVTKNGIGNAWSCVMYYLTGQKVEYSSTIRHRIDSLEKRITQWKGTIRLALGEQPLDLSVKSVDDPLAEIPGSLLHSRTPFRELGEKQKRKRIQDVEKFIENKTGMTAEGLTIHVLTKERNHVRRDIFLSTIFFQTWRSVKVIML